MKPTPLGAAGETTRLDCTTDAPGNTGTKSGGGILGSNVICVTLPSCSIAVALHEPMTWFRTNAA